MDNDLKADYIKCKRCGGLEVKPVILKYHLTRPHEPLCSDCFLKLEVKAYAEKLCMPHLHGTLKEVPIHKHDPFAGKVPDEKVKDAQKWLSKVREFKLTYEQVKAGLESCFKCADCCDGQYDLGVGTYGLSKQSEYGWLDKYEEEGDVDERL